MVVSQSIALDNGLILMIRKMIIERMINVIHENDLGQKTFESVLHNVIHEIDIKYLIVEDYFINNKKDILEEVNKIERE